LFSEAVENASPNLNRQRQSLICQPVSYLERLEPASLFPKAQPLEVELGSGDGSFLIEWARRHP